MTADTITLPTQSLVEPSQPGTGSRSRRRMIDFWNVLGVSVLAVSLWLAWQPAAETSISSAATAESSVTDAAQSSFVPAQKPIIEISVGHAVRTDEARGDHDDAFGSKVDAATWKHLVLKCRKVDGSTADVELLRPASWLTDQQAKVGGTIEVSVPECGIEGQAKVLAINDCPKLQPTPEGYCTVTGTFRHESAEILDITVESQPDPIGTTAVHPFWSEDRQDYVRADELTVGEHLLGDTGQIEITSISTRGSPEPVYNLEVLGDHNYKVSTASLLVHNGNCPTQPRDKNGKWLPWGSTGRGTRKPPGRNGEDIVQRITGGTKNNAKVDVPGLPRKRIPDQIYTDKGGLTHFVEVKDKSGGVSYTQQMRDTAAAAKANGATYDVYIPKGTEVSGPLLRAYNRGTLNLYYFWEE